MARSPALHRTAFVLTGCTAEAEDLVQETLIKVHQRWSTVLAATSPESYVWQILFNTFTSLRRRVRFSRERLVDAVPDSLMQDPTAAACEHATLWPAVLALPVRQRAVIVLRYYHDLPEARIAEILRCAPGTVKSTASKAMANLRNALASEDDG